MKNSFLKYTVASLVAIFTLSGFTCSKHVPVAPPSTESLNESVPQEQMSAQVTDTAVSSSDSTTSNQENK